MAEKSTIQVGIRLPRDLHRQLVELARDERRSLNSQVVWMLEVALAGDATASVTNTPRNVDAGHVQRSDP